VIISFKSKKDEKDCCDEKSRCRRWGLQGRKILQRLGEIGAADNLKIFWTLQYLHPHILGGDRDGQISVDLKHPYRLLFLPDHNPVPRKEDGDLDMEKITRIIILEVAEDTHG
jgi:plasmid maintenance system killer protein